MIWNSPALSNWDTETGGFMHLPAMGFIEAFQFTPTFTGPLEVKEGQVRTLVNCRWINVWAFHVNSDIPFEPGMDLDTFPFKFGTFMIDLEAISMSTEIMYGLTKDINLELSVPVYRIEGGIMDGFIEGFHNLFGISQHRRTQTGRDQARVFFIDEKSRHIMLLEDDLGKTALGDIAIYGGYRILESQPALSFRLGVKLPTHTEFPLSVNDGLDLSAMYAAFWRNNSLHFNHGSGVVYHSDIGDESLHLKRWRFTTATTIEWLPVKRTGYLLHVVANSPAADFPELDKPIIELSIGLRYHGRNYQMDIGIIENMFYYDNSPDFGVHASISQRF